MKRFSLNIRIVAIMLMFTVGCVLIAGIGFRSMERMNDAIGKLTEVSVPRVQAAYEIVQAFQAVTIAQYQYLNEDTAAGREAQEKRVLERDKKVREEIAHAIEIGSERGIKILEQVEAAYDSWSEKTADARKVFAAGDRPQALALQAESRQFRLDAEAQLEKIVELNLARMKADDKATEDTFASAKQMIILISLTSVFVAAITAFFVLRSASKAIQLVISELTQGSIQVSSAAQQIASSSETLSQAATEQAASLEETAASVEEMNSMVAKNSENAASTAETSSRSQQAVHQGKEVISKMIASMEAINRSSEGMNETVKVIEQIDKKTKVINEIVNKTELLSFNASVEAARAGEHGKGFAVVAEEVGNLARMSGAAAEEIATLLEESIRKVHQMVAETKKNVEFGSQVTRECGEVFESVVADVTKVSGMATEIAQASEEQSRGISEITKAMNQLDQMTQQNASTSQECAAAAEELSAQSESLQNAVEQLVGAFNGTGAIPEATSKPREKAGKPAKKANVVHLKGPRQGPQASEPAPAALKKAVGAPDYDSDGFADI